MMRPSTSMSPTCTLFGMPPRAMTAQFSNSNDDDSPSPWRTWVGFDKSLSIVY
jgi:hypothetical protein